MSESKAPLPTLLAAAGGFLAALPWLEERGFLAAWVGLTLVIVVTIDEPPHVAFRRWLLAGMVHVATVLSWYPRIAADTLHVSLFSGLLVGLLLVTWDAFRFGVFGYLVARMKPRGRSSCLIWPVIWVGLELIWPHIFPWRLGHTQIGWLPLMQVCELVGVYGVSFVLIWGGAAVAMLLHARPAESPISQRVAVGHVLCCGLVVLTATIWGGWRMREVESSGAERPQISIALIQPGRSGSEMRETLRDLSRSVRDETDLIVWPESTIGDFSLELTSFAAVEDVKEHTGALSLHMQPMPGLERVLLCAGGSYLEGTDGPQFNTAYLIDEEERIIGRYHKRQLMPWGEYMVGQDWIPGVREMLMSEGVRAGKSPDPLVLPGGERIGVLICYEDLLSDPARETASAGGEVLINLMNLSAFGESSAMWGHQQIARPRAIETRRWLLRCGITGSTSVVSPTGLIGQQATPHVATTLVCDVPLLEMRTLYMRWGDLFAWTCLVLSGLLVLQRLFFSPSRRAAEEEPEPGQGE